jgi:UDP-glucose 4-epimerase
MELLCGKRAAFYEVDVTDGKAVEDVFKKHPEIDSIIHFAALKVCSLILLFTANF